MSEYYGVSTPTSDFLAHYGVRGMKWGVRKARESGNSARLDRHYNRAVKKLSKLTKRTDRDIVQKAKRESARNIPTNALVGGLASGLGTYAINSRLPATQRLKYAAMFGGGMALANGIAGGIENLEYRRMLSKKGMQKNTAKRKAFEKEMRKAFNGTKYANKIGSDVHKNVEKTRQYYDMLDHGVKVRQKPQPVVAAKKKRATRG